VVGTSCKKQGTLNRPASQKKRNPKSF